MFDMPDIHAQDVEVIKKWACANHKYAIDILSTIGDKQIYNIWVDNDKQLSDAEVVERYSLSDVIWFCERAAHYADMYYKMFRSNIKSKLLDKGLSKNLAEEVVRIDLRNVLLKRIDFSLSPEEAAEQLVDVAYDFLVED